MSTSSLPDFDAPASKVISPTVLAHVVLRTANFEKMSHFYVTFLGGRIVFKNEMLCFITYDDEHHRIALINIPGTSPKIRTSSGLEHIAFTFPTLASLLLAYRQRKAHDILPIWNVNHGPTTSLYYRDVDGNLLETQTDNMDSPEAVTEFMMGNSYAENPIGTDIDPEDLIARLKRGESEVELKKRIENGPRGIPDLDSMG